MRIQAIIETAIYVGDEARTTMEVVAAVEVIYGSS